MGVVMSMEPGVVCTRVPLTRLAFLSVLALSVVTVVRAASVFFGFDHGSNPNG